MGSALNFSSRGVGSLEGSSREQIENKTPEYRAFIVMQDAANRLTNQHAVVSGEIEVDRKEKKMLLRNVHHSNAYRGFADGQDEGERND
jgi:hypothetical protein